jgi:hypothetical protein
MRRDVHDLASWLGSLPLRCPWVVLVVLVPSVLTFFLVERDVSDTGNLLYYYIPDLFTAPWRAIPNLLITPLINVGVGQIVILFLFVGGCGSLIERRLGAGVATGLYWATSAAAAVFAGLAWHALHPLFQESAMFQRTLERVYSGGSAAAFGMFGAYAVLSRRTWVGVAIFLTWETGYWIVKENFIPFFHFAGFFSGLGLMRWYLARRNRAGDPVRHSA